RRRRAAPDRRAGRGLVRGLPSHHIARGVSKRDGARDNAGSIRRQGMTHQGGARANSWPVRAWRAGCCAVLLALAGCHAPPQPPLALGMNARLGFDPLALARERGLLDAERVKVVELASATEVQRAFNNGLLDAAALTLDEALRLVDAGA